MTKHHRPAKTDGVFLPAVHEPLTYILYMRAFWIRTAKGDNMKNTWVLANAFGTDIQIIPVLIEVREYSDDTKSTLRVVVSLQVIEKAGSWRTTLWTNPIAHTHYPLLLTYRLADLFRSINMELLTFIKSSKLLRLKLSAISYDIQCTSCGLKNTQSAHKQERRPDANCIAAAEAVFMGSIR